MFTCMNNYIWHTGILIFKGVDFTALIFMFKIRDVNNSDLKDTGISSLKWQ